MADNKAILALSSFGLGAALLLIAAQIQRDPFAFTRLQAQSEQTLTSVDLIAPVVELRPPLVAEELAVPESAPAPPKARPKLPKPAQPVQSTQPPPCNPEWRELESGPAGRRVREICPAPSAEEVPRS